MLRTAAITALALSLAGASPAWAQDAPEPRPESPAAPNAAPGDPAPAGAETPQGEAQRLYALGNERFVERDYTEALEHYLQALERWDHPAIRFNVAECYISLVQPLKAYENLTVALASGPKALESEAHYQRGVQLKERLIAQLGRLTIESKVENIKVTLDGRPLELTAGKATAVVLPGGHQIVASAPGYVTRTMPVVLSPGEESSANVALELLPAPVVTRRRWPRWLPWAVGGAGATLALAGLPVMQSADSSYEAYDLAITEACAPPDGCAAEDVPEETNSLRDSGDLKRRSAQVLWTVGGAAVVTGAVLLLLNQPRSVRAEPSVTVAPAVLPGGGAIVGTWRF